MRDTGVQGRAKEGPVAYSDEVLGRAPLFQALDEDGTKALRAGVVDVTLARGDRLFDEGDAGDRLYVVLDGKIKLTRTAPDGRENHRKRGGRHRCPAGRARPRLPPPLAHRAP